MILDRKVVAAIKQRFKKEKIMKRFACLVLVLMMLALSACGGNRSISFGSCSFEHAHFTDAVGGHCVTVEKWYECEGSGIEMKTTEYGAIWCSEGTYIMFESGEKCPYCD